MTPMLCASRWSDAGSRCSTVRWTVSGVSAPHVSRRVQYGFALTNGGSKMWAQLITMRLKPGKEADLKGLVEQFRVTEQAGSGLVRSTAMVDRKDPSRVYMMVVFESEEKARARENDPRREAGLQAARAMMAEMFDGPPEFVDMNVVSDMTF